MKQGKNPPLAGMGLALGSRASALGNVNDAPAIASAQKLVSRCDRRRFRVNEQKVFIHITKEIGSESSGIFFGANKSRHALKRDG